MAPAAVGSPSVLHLSLVVHGALCDPAWMTVPFLAYPVAALVAHPDWGQVGRGRVLAPRAQPQGHGR